jgi:hypothetical protein
MRSRRTPLLLSLALLGASALATGLPSANAGNEVCPCVLVIEVDGLEPKDINREITPVLWELAHPQNAQVLGEGRAGFAWQAPRGVMAADTAAGAASLLTGAYPEATGVPANEFVEDGGAVRLESTPQDGAKQLAEGDMTAESLLSSVEDDSDGQRKTAGFVGNPALSGLVSEETTQTAVSWYPTNEEDPQNPPNPAYCDVPRRLPSGGEEDNPPPPYKPQCSAPDMVTLNAAVQGLNTSEADDVALAYIHLAELGVIKRRDGDVSSVSTPDGGPGTDVPRALAHLDASLAAFFNQIRNGASAPRTAAKWGDTYIFLVGNHGYETTLQSQRIPAPDGGDGQQDVELYLESFDEDGQRGKDLEYIPQGTLATIKATATDPAVRRATLKRAFDRLANGGPVEQTTLCGNPEQRTATPSADGTVAPGASQSGGCVGELVFLRPDLLPAEFTETQRREHLISEVHPTWRLDHLGEGGVPTRNSGDLVIVASQGWSTGRAAPTPMTDASEEDTGQLPITDTEDPYTGSAGGPRNRAVAAIVNGPAGGQGVRQVSGSFYPVTKGPDEGEFTGSPEAATTSVTEANKAPGDDADDDGHERQPITVDFAPTIAALLRVPLEDEQLHGRFLQEAFHRELAFPVDEVVETFEPEPDPVIEDPPPPEPEVVIIPPPPPPPAPPPPKTWDFDGLLGKVKVAVGDPKGRLRPRWRPGTLLDRLVIVGDFGKPLSAVKLSFYRKRRDRTAGAGRTVVRTLATFDPFSIKRSRRAKLTLRVPKVFKPTHVGIVVQQARKRSRREISRARRSSKGKPVPTFVGYGVKMGAIYRIKDARYLHRRAPKRSKRPRTQGG